VTVACDGGGGSGSIAGHGWAACGGAGFSDEVRYSPPPLYVAALASFMVEDAACVVGRRWRPPCLGWKLAHGDIGLHGGG
jgi:hypothetical protein